MAMLGKIRRAVGVALATFLCACSALVWAVGDGVGVANTDIYGRWKIARILDYADISALSEQQARKLLGKTIVVAKDKLVIGGETCDAPSYERTIEDTAKTMREKGHVSSANMGLPEQVTVIDAGCTVIFLKAPDRIVIQWRGFYFDAVRQKR